MKKLVTLALLLALSFLGPPGNALAAYEEIDQPPAGSTTSDHPAAGTAGGVKFFSPGVLGAVVSVLGFIALSASFDTIEATPSSTTTTHH